MPIWALIWGNKAGPENGHGNLWVWKIANPFFQNEFSVHLTNVGYFIALILWILESCLQPIWCVRISWWWYSVRVKWSHGKKHNLFSYQEPDTWNRLQYTVKIKVLEFVSENQFITLKYQRPNFRPQLTFEHKLFGKYYSNSYFFLSYLLRKYYNLVLHNTRTTKYSLKHVAYGLKIFLYYSHNDRFMVLKKKSIKTYLAFKPALRCLC